MAHYVMVGEGVYPSSSIENIYRDHLERKRWINGDIITFTVPTPIVYDEAKCEGYLLFRLAENITAIIVDERVKEEVQKRGIKGIHFYASGYWSG
ncbi:MAG: hypothetical protein HY080_02220 [Gammaproteobacteria bacterium]|nr:hypothetical protein [Gammaproteobacteria bacterium]